MSRGRWRAAWVSVTPRIATQAASAIRGDLQVFAERLGLDDPQGGDEMDRQPENKRVEIAALRDALRPSDRDRGDLRGDPGERRDVEPARVLEVGPIGEGLEAEERRRDGQEPAEDAAAPAIRSASGKPRRNSPSDRARKASESGTWGTKASMTPVATQSAATRAPREGRSGGRRPSGGRGSRRP